MTAHDPYPDLHLVTPEAEGEAALITIEASIEAARQHLHQKALDLGYRYVQRRAEVSDGSFAALNLEVRRRRNSITINWVLYHFKKGTRTGTTNLPKAKGSSIFDSSILKRESPEWLHEVVLETEMAARPLREALALLLAMERNLIALNDRTGGTHFTPLRAVARKDRASSPAHDED